METSLWDNKSRHNAQKLLDELTPMVAGSGISMKNLATYIAIEELLATLPSAKAHRSTLIGAIARTRHSGGSSIEDLERFYSEALGKRQQTSPDAVPWTFFVPVKVKAAEDVNLPIRFTMLGVDVEFVTRDTVAQRIGDPKGLGDPLKLAMMLGRRKPLEDAPEIYLTLTCEGTAWQEAWASVGPVALDSFRGLIELVYGYRVWRGGTEMPRTKIPLYGWMLMKTVASSLEAAPFIADGNEDFDLKPFVLNQDAANRIEAYLVHVKSAPQGWQATLHLISRCLQLYSEAMDATWNYRCLLALWQLAEALTLSELSNGDTKTVVSRMARFGTAAGLSGSGYKHVLRRIAGKRNDIVHRGQYGGVRDEYVNILKLACEDALVWLLNNQGELPTTRHIEMYYRFCDENDAHIEAARQAIAYIETHER